MLSLHRRLLYKTYDGYLVVLYLQKWLNMTLLMAMVGLIVLTVNIMYQTSGIPDFPISQAFYLAVLDTPLFLYQVFLPLTLITSIAWLQHLTNRGELTALRASGYPPGKLLRTLAAGAIISAIILLTVINPLAAALHHQQRLHAASLNLPTQNNVAINTRIQEKNKNYWWFHKNATNTQIINVGTLDEGQKTLYQVSVVEVDNNWQLQRVIFADSARLDNNEIVFSNPVIRDSQGKTTYTNTFTIRSNLTSNNLAVYTRSLQELPWYQYLPMYRAMVSMGYQADDILVALYKTLAIPFSAVVLCLLSVSLLPHQRQRSARNTTLLALSVGGFFYIITEIVAGLGMQGDLHPLVAVILPNLIVLFLACSNLTHRLRAY